MIYILSSISFLSTSALVFILGYYYGARHTAMMYASAVQKTSLPLPDKHEREFELNDKVKGYFN